MGPRLESPRCFELVHEWILRRRAEDLAPREELLDATEALALAEAESMRTMIHEFGIHWAIRDMIRNALKKELGDPTPRSLNLWTDFQELDNC